MADLTCPKCRNRMLEDASSASIFHCIRCEGVWLRKGQLEEFLRTSASARGVVLEAIGFAESPPASTTIKCPDCPMRYLQSVRYRGIEIERCPSCRGVYADAGEREKLAERVLKARQGWESALRDWQKLAGEQPGRTGRPRAKAEDAAILGMALVSGLELGDLIE